MFPWSLTEWTPPPTSTKTLKRVAAGSGLVELPLKSPIKGGKVHLFMGIAPRLKTVSNLSLRFPGYGITNHSNLRCGIPPASNPQRVRKRGHLFIGMMPTLKTVSNLSLGSPEYGMTNASNFKCGLPPASNPQRARKGSLI